MVRRSPFAELLLLVTAFVIWSLAFIALYGLHGVICSTAWIETERGALTGRLALWAAWGLHMAAAAAFLVWATRRARLAFAAESAARDRFLKAVTAGLAAAGVAATVWLGAPTLFLDLCR